MRLSINQAVFDPRALNYTYSSVKLSFYRKLFHSPDSFHTQLEYLIEITIFGFPKFLSSSQIIKSLHFQDINHLLVM